MGETIGELLPFAIGIALSPVPIIAVVLMLLAPDARSTGVAFAAGWSVGIVAVAAITAALSAGGGAAASDGQSTGSAVTRLVVGFLLLALAGRQWRNRDSAQSEPKWLASIDRLTPARSGLIGFGLAAVNPKNLLLCIAAGAAVGSAGLGLGSSIIALAVFTVLAAASVAAPAVGFLLAADKLRAPLDRLRTWIQASSAQVTCALLLVFGALLIGKSIGGL